MRIPSPLRLPLVEARPLSHSLVTAATRCTGSREKLRAALRECRRHVQGVPLRRGHRFARKNGAGSLAGSLRVASRLSPSLSFLCVSPFFIGDPFVEATKSDSHPPTVGDRAIVATRAGDSSGGSILVRTDA